MATDKWLIGLNGNWNTGADWSTGAAPGAADDVSIDAAGTYTITLTSAATIHSLDINAAGSTLSQAATAPLTIAGGLIVDAGTLILRAANSVGGNVNIYDGSEIDLSNSQALGSAELVSSGGVLDATANLTLDNQIEAQGGIFTATATKTLSLTGQFEADAGPLQFGSNLLPPGQGTIDFAPSSLTVNPGVSLDISTLTVMGNDTAVGLLAQADSVFINPDGTLDLGGQAAEIGSLVGSGLVTESGGVVSLQIDTGQYSGKMTGAIAVKFPGSFEIDSALTYTGGTSIFPSSIVQLGNFNVLGSVTGAIFVQGELKISGPAGSSFTLGNSISGGGILELAMQDAESVVAINHANTYLGGTDLFFGTLALGSAAGLGGGPITINAGGIEATQTETIDNALMLENDSQLSADSGKTLTIDSTWDVADNTNIAFGANGHNGTVVVHFESLTAGSNINVSVESGTLGVADNVPFLFADAAKTTIGAGATLDVLGNLVPILDLEGAGTILNTGSAAPLSIGSGHFAGIIKGALAGDFSGNLILSGTNTYAGGTTIEANGVLALGDGGTTGSIAGAIADQGILILDRSNAFTINHVISGTGMVEQRGGGTTTLAANNTYSGATIITAGTLASGHAGAFGTGEIVMEGGTLLSTVSQSVGNTLTLSGHDTLAAANGKTLSLTQDWDVSDNTAIVLGATGKAGTLSVDVTGGSLGAHTTTLVAAGTVDIGNAAAGLLIAGGDSLTIGAAGTLDLLGHDIAVTDLLGGGIVRSTSAATLTLKDAVFSGHINGDIATVVGDNVTLSGGGTFTGGVTVDANATLHLIGTAAEAVTFSGTNAHLTLDTPASFTGAIGGMVQSDRIDLTTISFGSGTHRSFDATTDILTVTDGTHTAHLQFVDGYVQSDFGIVGDGNGHTFVTTTVTTPPQLLDADALI